MPDETHPRQERLAGTGDEPQPAHDGVPPGEPSAPQLADGPVPSAAEAAADDAATERSEDVFEDDVPTTGLPLLRGARHEVEPEPVKPEPVEPGLVEPEPVEPGLVEPEPVEPEPVEPELVEPEPVEPGLVEPELVEPGLVEPELVEPEPVEPELVEPELAEPEPVEPELAEPELVEPEPVEPEPDDEQSAPAVADPGAVGEWPTLAFRPEGRPSAPAAPPHRHAAGAPLDLPPTAAPGRSQPAAQGHGHHAAPVPEISPEPAEDLIEGWGEQSRDEPAEDAVHEPPDDRRPAGDEGKPAGDEPEADEPADRSEDPTLALSPRQRLLSAMRPRASRAQLLALVLCFVLGLAGFLAVRQNQSLGLDSMRQSDLVSLLDNVTEKSNRLEDETRRLQNTADQLKTGSDKSAAALAAAQQRLELLGILAGTSPAVGSGIQLTINDPQHRVSAAIVLDTVQELRDAGAEAIQIGDVRVVASTAFVDGDAGVRIDGTEVNRPYVVLVVGDPQTLSAALGIPGGVLEVLKQQGASGSVELKQTVTVSALRSVSAPQYAHPATSAAP